MIAKKKSYFLIELIVSLSIVTFFFSVTISYIISQKDYLISDLYKISSLFTFSHQMSLASCEKSSLSFNSKNNSYETIIQEKRKIYFLSKFISFGFLENSYGPPSNPTKLIKEISTFNSTEPNNFIFFLPNGFITPGTIYLVSQDKKFMGAVTISVSEKAFNRIYFYEKKKWKIIK